MTVCALAAGRNASWAGKKSGIVCVQRGLWSGYRPRTSSQGSRQPRGTELQGTQIYGQGTRQERSFKRRLRDGAASWPMQGSLLNGSKAPPSLLPSLFWRLVIPSPRPGVTGGPPPPPLPARLPPTAFLRQEPPHARRYFEQLHSRDGVFCPLMSSSGSSKWTFSSLRARILIITCRRTD